MRPSHLNDAPDASPYRDSSDVTDMPFLARGCNGAPGANAVEPRAHGPISCHAAAAIEGSLSHPAANNAECEGPARASDAAVLERARREYAACEMRWAKLGPNISCDPAWNILLDLLISEIGGKRLSVTAVCVGARSSSTTGIRYIAMLQATGLVERVPDERDRRRTYVQLTEEGRRTVCELLAAV